MSWLVGDYLSKYQKLISMASLISLQQNVMIDRENITEIL